MGRPRNAGPPHDPAGDYIEATETLRIQANEGSGTALGTTRPAGP